MKKKVIIISSVFIILLLVAGIITNYIDSGRVTTGHEPNYCLKIVSNDGTKVTYWGLGYKVIRYVGVSPKENFDMNIGVKMGSWFMKYELPESKKIDVEYQNNEIEKDNKIVSVNDKKKVDKLVSILENSKYNNELCKGIVTHKITVDGEIYYLKKDCQELQRGNKQAKLSDEDFNTILEIIE